MAMINTIVFLFALVGVASAQVRAPSKVNICVQMGNNVHSTLTVLSTEVSNYPGHVKGACSKVCSTVCKDMLREVNAAGQCICKGLALKCGANAVPSNDKKSCKCLVGFKGDAIKGCVDVNECAATKSVCPTNSDCTNTAGSFKCTCKAGFEGNITAGCRDIDECALSTTSCSGNNGCINTVGSFECKPCGRYSSLVKGQCQCERDDYFGDAHVMCKPEYSYSDGNDFLCVRFSDLIHANGAYYCAKPCGYNARRPTLKAECQCRYEGYFGDANVACKPEYSVVGDPWYPFFDCVRGSDLFYDDAKGALYCTKPCGFNARRVNGECKCEHEGYYFGDANVACIPENATWDPASENFYCNDGYQYHWLPSGHNYYCAAN